VASRVAEKQLIAIKHLRVSGKVDETEVCGFQAVVFYKRLAFVLQHEDLYHYSYLGADIYEI